MKSSQVAKLMKLIPTLFACLLSVISFAQEIAVEAEVATLGLFSSEEINPFWFSVNSSTAVGAATTFSSVANVVATMDLENESELSLGTALLFRNEIENEFQRRDLFAQYKNSWLIATAGPKRQEDKLNGLSISNQSFIFSRNARPLPGLQIEANKPLKLTETFSIDWSIGHYYLNDDRYVEDVMVHEKRLGLITTFGNQSKLTLKIQHVAQWGGTTPEGIELDKDISTFIKVFFAAKGDKSGDFGEALNAVGNHIGTFFFDYTFLTEVGQFSVYHDHPFEDGSGTRFANFPDGIWGVNFQPENKKIISQFLYEFIDTSDQSGVPSTSGADGYFGNNIYRSGWTYEGNVIGYPLILSDPSIILNDQNTAFISNRSQVHHFGFAGTFKKVDWQVKSSIVKQMGTYRKPFEPELTSWFNYVSASYTTEKYGKFTLLGGFDSYKIGPTVAGGGLKYMYGF